MADLSIKISARNAANSVNPAATIKVSKSEKNQNTGTNRSTPKKEKFSSAKVPDEVISKSKDGDTASASKISKTRLEETRQDSKQPGILETQAKAKADRATDFLNAQIANEDLDQKQPNDAEVVYNKVGISSPNPYIESLKEELKKDIRQAEADSAAQRAEIVADDYEEQTVPNIELDTKNIEKEAAQISAMETAEANEEERSFEPQITSFDGYSNQQLRQLYLDGTISRYSYDSEMSARAEESENFEEREQVFREGIVREIENEGKTERIGEAVKQAFSEDSSQKLTADQRMDMMNAAENSERNQALAQERENLNPEVHI